MSTRTITGNLANDPEVVPTGSISSTKFRFIENTGDYRHGKFAPHDTPTTHHVEARFELGQTTAATLHKGAPVAVVGREHTNSWGPDDNRSYGRIIDADIIGVDLNRAVAHVRRTRKPDEEA
ncbi:hypothetical protein AX769_22485 (plasmid) [Frondihabitans sp. PAMC 28766]|uniref:single-stranded DNA-binding protein n=1 Tax=Frondihabitans sp. PAMC 28766 TaxID=1795630 RepID=UPI00078B29AE|nr:single-stranded DNA-binding protein [Frondihabitans sp. PAMC 28766]AMM22902.1 hypothetical protein AX769_22485 [Frondihabitans sp. PAMC 28766]